MRFCSLLVYHKHTLPQLYIFRKSQELYSNPELASALNYCIEHDLYSANDFRDALACPAQPKTEFQQLKNPALPAKYSSVAVQTRDVSIYGQMTGGAL
jgi:hypothetical protein